MLATRLGAISRDAKSALRRLRFGTKHPLFDAEWYLARNPDLRDADIDPLDHFLSRGGSEGRDPCRGFSTRWYLDAYADVRASGVNPLVHYTRVGARKGYDPNPLFDSAWYLARNPDVARRRLNPLVHYLQYGWREERSPHPFFDLVWYLKFHTDIRDAGVEPLGHYLDEGWSEGRDVHPLFDSAWYAQTYSDIAGSNLDPASHYWRFGRLEGRNPNPYFDAKWYLERHREAAATGLTAFDHYLQVGRFEGLRPSPTFDPNSYVRANPDVLKSELDPLTHWLRVGIPGGRSIQPGDAPDATDCPIRCLKALEVERTDTVALFVAHAPEGAVRPDVPHYLRALAEAGAKIVLILASEDVASVPDRSVVDLASGVYVREDRGFEFGAWAHVLGIEPQLYKAGTLLLLDDSVVGPLQADALKEVWARLQSSSADVIGLTESFEEGWHLQSYFLALKTEALSLRELHRFFLAARNLSWRDEVVLECELAFTPMLRDSGMRCEALFPSSDEGDPTLVHWRELIEQGFPFINAAVARELVSHDDPSGWRNALLRQGYDVRLLEQSVAPAEDDEDKTGADVNPVYPEPQRPLRISWIGPWNYAPGLGVASRGYVSALWHESLEVNLHGVRKSFHTHARTTPFTEVTSFSGAPDLAIVHLNPDAWPGVLETCHRNVMAAARRTAGLWVWEMSHIPAEWYPAFDEPDAVWTPSSFCADVFRNAGARNVEIVPHVVEIDPARFEGIDAAVARAEFGLDPAAKVILYAFDGASYLIRKNPFALVRAFKESGLGSRGWVLVLKTKSLFDRLAEGKRLADLASEDPAVHLINRALNRQDMTALFWACDVYASPHCSEGFGLTIAEAMATGKVVVATDYGGSRDFLDDTCGIPVRYTHTILDADFGHYTKGGEWAEVDEQDLTRALLSAAAEVDDSRSDLGERARRRIRERLSVEAIGERMKACAEALLRS